jgi:hypothetical protein
MSRLARTPLCAGLAILLCLCVRAARAESADGFWLILPPAAVAEGSFGASELSLGLDAGDRLLPTSGETPVDSGFRIDLSGPFRAAFSGLSRLWELPPRDPSVEPGLFDRRTLRLTAGALMVVPVVGGLSWWRHERLPFHVNQEGFFGRETYAGGSDKASHFVVSYAGSQVLSGAYRSLGHSPAESHLLALGVVTVSGVLVEVGDGTAHYGFAWEDVGADVLGALTGIGIEAAGIGDVVGFRYGWVGARMPASAEESERIDTDYSREIYTADVKLSGVSRRLNRRPGLARFLLLSMTYGTKGYPYSSPELRERNLGFEVGLNLQEILLVAGVKETTWWGRTLLTFFEYVRLPYTGIGYQYDLNHGRWHGPTAGNAWDPGI